MTPTVVAPNAPPSRAIITFTLTSDNNPELVASLSGNPTEFRLVSSAPGEIVITAIDSYKERFRRASVELREEQRKLEKVRESLRRAHVYTKILAELHQVWWPQLPDQVQHTLMSCGRTDLPDTIVSWWLQWHEYSPYNFPLPLSLRHFGPVTLDTETRRDFIFDYTTGEESRLSKATEEAWNILPDDIRQLMLFSWAAVHSIRNDVTLHPDLGNLTAREILDHDFHTTFQSLHSTACYFAGRSRGW